MKTLKPLYKALYFVALTLGEFFIRLLWPMRTIGKKHIKACKGGFVLAGNHISAIDPMFIVIARGYGKKMMVMGKEELFTISPVLNFLWHVFGAFPVERGSGDRGTLNTAIAEVKSGRGLLIFPEGTRTKDGKLGRLKSGAFVVAMQAGTKMVPCCVWYKKGRAKLFRRVVVIFGAPVSLEELGLVGEYSASKLREAKRRYAEILQNLYEENKSKLK